MDRETIVQITASALAVVLFVAGLALLSTTYGSSTDQGVELSANGSIAVVGLIAVFVVAMPVVGYVAQQYEPDAD